MRTIFCLSLYFTKLSQLHKLNSVVYGILFFPCFILQRFHNYVGYIALDRELFCPLVNLTTLFKLHSLWRASSMMILNCVKFVCLQVKRRESRPSWVTMQTVRSTATLCRSKLFVRFDSLHITGIANAALTPSTIDLSRIQLALYSITRGRSQIIHQCNGNLKFMASVWLSCFIYLATMVYLHSFTSKISCGNHRVMLLWVDEDYQWHLPILVFQP
jgi:hypothetical protein